MAAMHNVHTTPSDTHFLSGKRQPLHYLREPHGFNSGMAWGNAGYQMHYSVETLEKQLASEGNPHILQLNSFSYNDDWKNPTSWHLYADGYEVASGDGDYARQCFEESAEAFRDSCRRAIDQADLPALSEREYYILDRARAIARFEPFDNGSHAMGGREGRAQ